jgi:hypothetical protein
METNGSGVAVFDDLVPGEWVFRVHADASRSSAEKAVLVAADRDAQVTLELQPANTIEGTVRDLGGVPLPRAGVDCLVIGPSGAPVTAGARTDTEGKFAIDLIAPAPPSALCTVIGPMGAVDAFKVTVGAFVDLSVPAVTGTLLVPDWGKRRSDDALWLAAPDGRVINLTAVAARIGRFGSPLTIPALAVGRWRLIRPASLPQWLALGGGLAGSLPAAAELTLRPGETKTLTVYEPAAQGESR